MEEEQKQELKCKNCEKPLKPNWEFCPYCKQPVHVKPKKCKKCGEELEEGMLICPVCGKDVGEGASKKSASKKKQSDNKTSLKKRIEEQEELSDVPFRNLFEAYSHGKLPFANGYIVSSFFSETSYYSIYEIVSYAGVKEIFNTDTGLQFVTGGKKLFVLAEPDTYHLKSLEPVSRADGERIPKRFSELEIITSKNMTNIMISKEPNESFGSFTILRPTGVNFAVVFYNRPDVYESLVDFFIESLNRQVKVPEHDAKIAAQEITKILKRHMGFEGEYR
jgi:RNA polymerase subunit RPABC4/transcription elongation factor Spt4